MRPENRHQRGLARLKQMQGAVGEQAIAYIESISPDLARYALEFVFGDIHSRPGLDLKSREIAAVAALTALGNASPQLRAHIHGALNVGCSKEEVIEIMIEMAAYAGFPAALNGIYAAKEVFAQWDGQAAGKSGKKSNGAAPASKKAVRPGAKGRKGAG